MYKLIVQESGKKLLVRTSSFHLMVIYDIRYKPNVSATARGSGIVDGLQIAVFEWIHGQ